MDVHFQFEGLHFEWESTKATSNFTKHGLSFETACEVFLDPLMRIYEASVPHEERLAAIGATQDREVLYVVHIEFAEDWVRIISARLATKSEKMAHENNG